MVMKLHEIRIQGFRKHFDTTIKLDKCSFLIGMNNVGKSTIFKAIEYLLTDVKKLDDQNDYLGYADENDQNIPIVDEVIITGEFRNCPVECSSWRGFKGRIFEYPKEEGSDDTGLSFKYRKTYSRGQNVKIEILENTKFINPIYEECENISQLIENGFPQDILEDLYPGVEHDTKLKPAQKKKLLDEEDYFIYSEGTENWISNPGGIPGNVLSKLPKFLLIPAQDRTNEISSERGALIQVLNSLFNDVRETSENFIKAQKYLDLLEKELDPNDENKDFGQMMNGLNKVLSEVFPNIKLRATANLSDPNKTIKPSFDISMISNFSTPVENQGTGAIRSAVFALLRYRDIRQSTARSNTLIIGFEEPEMYLHPSAAIQLQDTIYDLAKSKTNQIICTTHSPYMINLSKIENQILNHLTISKEEVNTNGTNSVIEKVYANAFNVSQAFKDLHSSDKNYVKMLLKIDDYMAKVFFTSNVLIVEGDTEDIVLLETINRMPEKIKLDIKQNWSIVKARGKATIISLVKYFNAMGIDPFVMHDKDTGVEGAERFNQPIADNVDPEKLFVLEDCIEDVLGYTPPNSEKPYKAYKYISDNWGNDWNDVDERWKELCEKIFDSSFEKYKKVTEV